jgi:hypothetical protein
MKTSIGNPKNQIKSNDIASFILNLINYIQILRIFILSYNQY